MPTLLTIAGGVALILFGVRYLRKGLDRLFGMRLAGIIQRLANNRLRAFATGIGVAVVAPSSTTISVLAVQTVQAGHLTARQALAIMLGANIGLTVLVQLVALRIEEYAPLLVLIGVILFQFTRGDRTRGIGQVILSLGFIFLGVLTIGSATAGVDPTGDIADLLAIAGNYPWLIAALGAGLAMLLQSAAATIALVIGLIAGGQIDLPLPVAVAWVVGANVGIVLTTLMIGWARVESRRLAMGNLLAKGAMAILVLALLGPVTELIARLPGTVANQVAHTYTGFNLVLAAIALPLVEVLGRLVERLIPAPPEGLGRPFGPRYIDENRPVDSVALALSQSRQEILHMSEVVRGMFADIWRALKANDEALARDVAQRDDRVDHLDACIKRFLTRLGGRENDAEETAEQMRQLRYLSELEMIGDVIDKNLSELVLKKIELRVDFSTPGWKELEDFRNRVAQNMEIAEAAFTTRDRDLAQQLMRHKQRLDDYHRDLRDRHFARLNAGLRESLETSSIHLDMLNYLKRINGCVTHVAYAILQPTGETAPGETEG